MNKIYRYIIGVCLATLINIPLFAQNPQFKIEVCSGIEFGEWNERYPSEITTLSPFAFSIPAKIAVIRQDKRFGYGVEIKNNLIFLSHFNYLEAPVPDGSTTSYWLFQNIAKKESVNFTSFYGSLRYLVFQKNAYSFTPNLSVGTFIENSVHPDKGLFKGRFAYKLELMNEIDFNNFNLIVSPVYSRFHMQTGLPKNTKVLIYHLGIDVGVAYKF